jgi:N-acyl-D-amino-acid deacylase
MSDTSCDLLIRNALVFDGTGGAAIRGDVAVSGDRIVSVGSLSNWSATTTVDAKGLALAPGFIDAHTHDDRAVLSSPDMTAKVSQGVTSVIGGNCGISLAPLKYIDPPPPLNLLGDQTWFRFETMAEYMAEVDNHPPAVNIAMLVGHSTLRAAVMDSLDRPATEGEIEQMSKLLDEAMEAGCVGLSTGLAYPTAINAPTEEVITLARRAAQHGGLYATHMRDEEDGVVESVDETVRIGTEADAPVVISHHKACGRNNWGRTVETLARIDAANDAGKTVDFDVYPYIASSTVLLHAFIDRAEKVLITWSESHPEMAGEDLMDIVKRWDCTRDEAVDRLQPAGAIYFQMDEEDLQRVLAHPASMVGSDGLPHDRRPHPRLWGTFPRVLGHYSRELGLFPLETAIHKMTGLTARVFGLLDRGIIAPGNYADLVLFDPETVLDKASFEEPTALSAGIHQVYVNGDCVWNDSASTGARPGKMLRRRSI